MALGAASAQAANLVTNGDFEANPANGLSIVGWAVNGNGVADDQVFYHSFTHDVAFGDPAGGGISQDIVTTPGSSYALSFWLLDEAFDPLDTFVVSFGGFSQSFVGTDLPPSAYTLETLSIDGAAITGGLTTLSFQGAIDPFTSNFQPWNLDDVSVEAVGGVVPEPATWALMLSGFFGAGVLLRRRRLTPAVAL